MAEAAKRVVEYFVETEGTKSTVIIPFIESVCFEQITVNEVIGQRINDSTIEIKFKKRPRLF